MFSSEVLAFYINHPSSLDNPTWRYTRLAYCALFYPDIISISICVTHKNFMLCYSYNNSPSSSLYSSKYIYCREGAAHHSLTICLLWWYSPSKANTYTHSNVLSNGLASQHQHMQTPIPSKNSGLSCLTWMGCGRTDAVNRILKSLIIIGSTVPET